MTGQLKELILGALNDAGGQAYLVEVARAHPAVFLGLLAKLLPLTVGNDPAEPLEIRRVIVVPSKDDAAEAYARMLGKD